jgi:alpha-galactosidase
MWSPPRCCPPGTSTSTSTADGSSAATSTDGSSPIPQRFPSGVAALANYVHGKGLRFGLYLHPGLQKEAWDANGTIAGTSLHGRDIADTTQPGSTKEQVKERSYRIDFTKRGSTEFIQSYANLLASWGVDYLKLDVIGSGRGRRHIDNKDEVAAWWTAIEKSGRPIGFELSYALDYDFASFWKAHANGWRVTGDIEGNTPEKVWRHVLDRFEVAPKWAPFAGPGGWTISTRWSWATATLRGSRWTNGGRS